MSRSCGQRSRKRASTRDVHVVGCSQMWSSAEIGMMSIVLVLAFLASRRLPRLSSPSSPLLAQGDQVALRYRATAMGAHTTTIPTTHTIAFGTDDALSPGPEPIVR